jgi:hypothetical protein
MGVQLNGSNVKEWNDQSGNGHHAIQLATASQPTLRSAALNGLPVVRFDGVDDFLTFTLPINGLSGLSLFLVAANTQDQNGGANFAEHAALFWNETQFWSATHLTPFQSSVTVRFGTTQSGNGISVARPTSIGNAFTVTAAIKNGTTDTLYVDGTLVASQGGKFSSITGTRDTGNLGRGYNDNTYFAGEIAEAVIYSRALTASEQQTLEQYLTTKYGLSTPPPPEESILSITPSGTNVVVCWSLPCPNCALEQTDNLNPPISWSPVNASATVNGNQSCVTLPITSSGRFIRLHGM